MKICKLCNISYFHEYTVPFSLFSILLYCITVSQQVEMKINQKAPEK